MQGSQLRSLPVGSICRHPPRRLRLRAPLRENDINVTLPPRDQRAEPTKSDQNAHPIFREESFQILGLSRKWAPAGLFLLGIIIGSLLGGYVSERGVAALRQTLAENDARTQQLKDERDNALRGRETVQRGLNEATTANSRLEIDLEAAKAATKSANEIASKRGTDLQIAAGKAVEAQGKISKLENDVRDANIRGLDAIYKLKNEVIKANERASTAQQNASRLEAEIKTSADNAQSCKTTSENQAIAIRKYRYIIENRCIFR